MRILGCLLIFAFSCVVNAQSQLNGISLYRYLNKEFFIAALYTEETGSSADQLLSSEKPMKMVMRVTVKRWKPKTFKQMWIRDLSLNNELESQPELARQLVEFTDLLKENLTTGDEIVVSYSPGSGTTLMLNQQEIEQLRGKEFFNAVLRAWIGNAPPSRQFQSEILGEKSAATNEVMDRYNALEIQPERVALVASWRKSETAEAEALVKAQREAEERARRAEEERIAEQKRLEELRQAEERRIAEEKRIEEERKRLEEERRIAEVKRKEEERKLAEEQAKADAKRKAELQKLAEERRIAEEKRKAEEQKKAEALRLAKAKADEEKRKAEAEKKRLEAERKKKEEEEQALALEAQRKQEEAEKALAALQLKAVEEVVEEDDVGKILTTSAKLSADQKKEWETYRQEIVKEIEAEIEYPAWSKKNRHRGDVTADVTLNPNGSLKEVKVTKKTRYTLLNDAIEAAIEKIGEFEDFPEWVKDETVTVSVSHTFKPEGRAR